MKRFLVSIGFTVIIAILYQTLEVNFFELDLQKRLDDNLFSVFRPAAEADSDQLLLNIGKLSAEEVNAYIDTLLTLEPKIIGLDLCGFRGNINKVIRHVSRNPLIVLNVECKSSIIKDEHNAVRYFMADRNDYYELAVAGFNGRGNDREMINYRPVKHYFSLDLEYLADIPREFVNARTILIGYTGDYLTDEQYYFENSFITPLNKDFGEYNVSPDMPRLFVSANIISTIYKNDFINEIGSFGRMLILLMIILVNVTVLTLIRPKKLAVAILLALVLFVLLNMVGTYLIVHLFVSGYYLNLNELTVCLLITSIFTLFFNSTERKGVERPVK